MSAIVGLSFAAVVASALVVLVGVWRVSVQLNHVQDNYLPLLSLGPEVQKEFEALNKRVEEAVAAKDPELLAATQADEERLLAALGSAPPIVEPARLAELRSDIHAWYLAARDVANRLIQGEAGEEMVAAIEQMQAKRRTVVDQIQRTVVLDRTRLTDAFRSARRAQLFAAWIALAIPVGLAAAVAAVALGISRAIRSSLGELTRGFARFGRGELDNPIPDLGDDELAEAARHANRMAGNLERVTGELRRRQADLERANQELEAFSYSVSHDLRAPLRSIDGFSQALLEDFEQALPAQGKDYLARIRAAAQRMAALIDDILRLSRISRSELRQTPLDLSELARSVIKDLAATYPGAAPETAVQDGLRAEGDVQLLRIALENLLGNAWKFASKVPHPKIEVGSTTLEGEVAFFVRDNGVGFDMKYASKLFAPFQRLHGAQEFPGTGIGLATVQRIVRRHGGRVWAEAEPGRGATFFFTLPAGADR